MTHYDVHLIVKVENVTDVEAAEEEALNTLVDDAVGGHISDIYILKVEEA